MITQLPLDINELLQLKECDWNLVCICYSCAVPNCARECTRCNGAQVKVEVSVQTDLKTLYLRYGEDVRKLFIPFTLTDTADYVALVKDMLISCGA